MDKTQSSEKKKSPVILIVVLVILLIAAFFGGFFWYVNACKLFPTMKGMFGEDHFSSEDHCGIYDYGVMEDITASERNEASKLVLVSGAKLEQKNVRVDTTSYKKYNLLPCGQPADVSLIFDSDAKLCCSEIVYHYTDDEVSAFEQDQAAVTEAVESRFCGNPLTSVYAKMARSFGLKQYNVIRNVTAEDTQLIVQEYYRTKAYD